MSKKEYAILSSLGIVSILLGSLFYYNMVQAQDAGKYDPWADLNDDGTINILDFAHLATKFLTSGEPINKTGLLLELETRVEALESTVLALESVTDGLSTNVDTVNTLISDLEGTVNILETHNETYSSTLESISGYSAIFNWQDIQDMEVEITLETDATLLIVFSAQASITGTGQAMYVRAIIDSTQANPSTGVTLTRSPEWASYSYTFYSSGVSSGTHTVKIQWKLHDELGSGQVTLRTLAVIALP